MGKSIFILVILFFGYANAQDDTEHTNTRINTVGDLRVMGSGLWVRSAPSATVKGSPYLFENWTNISTIYSGEGKMFTVRNLNYDTKIDRFVTKVSVDSVYVFNTRSLKQAKVNNQFFKLYNKNNVYSYFELIAFGKGKEILKQSKKKIKKGAKDPFTNSYKQDRYVLNVKYFVNSEEGMQELQLKKKSFLALFGKHASQIKKFMKKQKLSFKKDLDIAEIFKYYNQI
jgi:hypothetical protein